MLPTCKNSRWLIRSIGRIHPQKGLDTLVRAAGVLKDHQVNFSIVINGPEQDTTYRRHLLALVKELEVHEFVEIGDGLLPAQVEAAWKTADFSVFPSVCDEGLSFALLEAMQVGAVPIASRSGGNVEALEGRLASLLFYKGDYLALAHTLLRLMNSPDEYRILSETCRERVSSEFSIRRHLDSLISVASGRRDTR